MAALNFTKTADCWVAECTVNADFNLHIERVNKEYITVDVSTVANGAKQCAYIKEEASVFDHDFNALVYPKYITIKSWSEPIAGKCFVTETT